MSSVQGSGLGEPRDLARKSEVPLPMPMAPGPLCRAHFKELACIMRDGRNGKGRDDICKISAESTPRVKKNNGISSIVFIYLRLNYCPIASAYPPSTTTTCPLTY